MGVYWIYRSTRMNQRNADDTNMNMNRWLECQRQARNLCEQIKYVGARTPTEWTSWSEGRIKGSTCQLAWVVILSGIDLWGVKCLIQTEDKIQSRFQTVMITNDCNDKRWSWRNQTVTRKLWDDHDKILEQSVKGLVSKVQQVGLRLLSRKLTIGYLNVNQ